MDLLLILVKDGGLDVGEEGRVEGIVFLILDALSLADDGSLFSYYAGQIDDDVEAGQPESIVVVVSPTAPAWRGRDDSVDCKENTI